MTNAPYLLPKAKWGQAQKARRFKEEIAPVVIPQKKVDPIVIDTDEYPRHG